MRILAPVHQRTLLELRSYALSEMNFPKGVDPTPTMQARKNLIRCILEHAISRSATQPLKLISQKVEGSVYHGPKEDALPWSNALALSANKPVQGLIPIHEPALIHQPQQGVQTVTRDLWFPRLRRQNLQTLLFE